MTRSTVLGDLRTVDINHLINGMILQAAQKNTPETSRLASEVFASDVIPQQKVYIRMFELRSTKGAFYTSTTL